MATLRRSAFVVFGADAGARVLGFLASAHLARSLDTAAFGMVVIGFSFLSYALWFVDLGLASLGTRELSREPGERAFAPHEILWTRLTLAVIVSVPAIGLALLLYPTVPLRWVVCGYLLNAVPFALTLEWYYQGIRRYAPLIVSRTVSAALYLGMLLLFVFSPGDLVRVPIIYVGATLVPALVLFAFKRPGDSFAPRGLSLARCRALVLQSGLIGVGGIFAQTVQLLPPLVLGAVSTDRAGLLGAALRIVAVMLIIDRVFAVLYLPAATRLMASDRGRAARELERVLAWVIVAGFALAVPLTVHASAIMRLVFGAPFVAGGEALALTAWFAVVTLINSVFAYGLIAAGSEGAYLRSTVAGGIAAAVITLVCVFVWDLRGAAIAMVVSELVIVGLTWSAFRRLARPRFARPLLISIAVAAAVIAASWALDLAAGGLDVLWRGPAVMAAFVALAFLCRAVRRDDVLWILRR